MFGCESQRAGVKVPSDVPMIGYLIVGREVFFTGYRLGGSTIYTNTQMIPDNAAMSATGKLLKYHLSLGSLSSTHLPWAHHKLSKVVPQTQHISWPLP